MFPTGLFLTGNKKHTGLDQLLKTSWAQLISLKDVACRDQSVGGEEMGGGSPGGHLLFDRRWWMTLEQPLANFPISRITVAIRAPGPAWRTKGSTGIQMSPNGKGIDSRRKCNSDSNELLIGENHFLFSWWVKTDGGVFALTDTSDGRISLKGLLSVMCTRDRSWRIFYLNNSVCIISLLSHLILLSCFCKMKSVTLDVILHRWDIVD